VAISGPTLFLQGCQFGGAKKIEQNYRVGRPAGARTRQLKKSGRHVLGMTSIRAKPIRANNTSMCTFGAIKEDDPAARKRAAAHMYVCSAAQNGHLSELGRPPLTIYSAWFRSNPFNSFAAPTSFSRKMYSLCLCVRSQLIAHIAAQIEILSIT
jgi:hypothetical protein